MIWDHVVVGSNPTRLTSASFKNKYSVWQGYFLGVSNVLLDQPSHSSVEQNRDVWLSNLLLTKTHIDK
jgi:hypothetical protein